MITVFIKRQSYQGEWKVVLLLDRDSAQTGRIIVKLRAVIQNISFLQLRIQSDVAA
jgi:hypothetical protein